MDLPRDPCTCTYMIFVSVCMKESHIVAILLHGQVEFLKSLSMCWMAILICLLHAQVGANFIYEFIYIYIYVFFLGCIKYI